MEADTEDELIFEVAFVEEERGRSSLRNMEACLASLEGIRRKPLEQGVTLFQYFNPDTQATCDFVISGTALSCEMAMPRATFFALECLPLMVRVARELRMQVEVISPPYDEQPFVACVEDLMVRWQKANLEERQFQESQGRQFYLMSSTQLEAIWEYELLRRDMARRYSRTRVQVPAVVFWGDKVSRRALRVSTWPRLASVSFPESDLLRLESPPAPLKDGAVYSAPQVVQAAGSLFKSLAMPVQHYFFDKEGHIKELIEMFRSLPKVNLSKLVQISYADVLDEEPPLWD